MENKFMVHGLRMKEEFFLQGMVFLLLIHETVDGNLVHGNNWLEIDNKLRQINRPAVKSIQSEDGDIIDCVDIYKQPAFDHHSLKNHTIQMKPSSHPFSESNVKKDEVHEALEASQLWQKSGSCPEGTIPIRRIRKQDLLRAASLEEFGRKKPRFSSIASDIHQNVKGGINYSTKAYSSGADRSVAILLSQGVAYLAAAGKINVWNPRVAAVDEFSAAHISLSNGPYYDFESVQAGWVVNPQVYGDRRTRFFAYWTADASKKTGCFDLTCPGFVQTNHSIVLGAPINPVSTPRGAQYEISISIRLDVKTGNWWLRYGETDIGYWPKSLFGALSHMASAVEWGGEVKSSHVRQNHPHTATQMGSGQRIGPGWGNDCFIRTIRIEDNSGIVKFPPINYPHTDEYNCYNIYYRRYDIPDPEFYFGGPGYDRRLCP